MAAPNMNGRPHLADVHQNSPPSSWQFLTLLFIFVDFVTSNFSAVPNLMLAVGVMGLMAGLVGITVGATASR